MSETSIVRTETPGILAEWQHDDLEREFYVATSLPSESPKDRHQLLAIIESECRSAEGLLGQVIYLGDYVAHPVLLTDEETGEQTVGRRIILLQPGDTPIAFVSQGIAQSISRIAWATGHNPPYDPPIKVRLVSQRVKRGRTFKLIPVE